MQLLKALLWFPAGFRAIYPTETGQDTLMPQAENQNGVPTTVINKIIEKMLLFHSTP